ncbi:Mbov_0395 family pilin-like conjugal transfer protein [Spiroplasma sp. DGKH1]|uniref:Mbov_0395 family pilin-like conjugal transfer protein n=1 Tax=Spiroplasma sp. DGKH1 TaxID=3050074 RepID=UPI0034C6B83D
MSIIFGLLGLFCAVKCAIIGFHIAKSADNAEQRSEYVRSLIWPIVGLLAAVIIPTVVTVILQQVQAAQIGG